MCAAAVPDVVHLVCKDGLELRRREIPLQTDREQEARTKESDDRGFEHDWRGIRLEISQRHDVSEINGRAGGQELTNSPPRLEPP